jgi:pyrroline-5-carboxylate reductase
MLTRNVILKGLKRSRFICPGCSVFTYSASFHTTFNPKMNDTEAVKQLYPNGVFKKIACIGAGTMAQAFIEPLIAGNVQPPGKFTVFDVNVATMKQVSQSYKGVATADSIHECVRGADLVICAVKPQNLTSSFFVETKKGADANCVLLSVVAGKRLQTFYEGGFAKIVRSMPNTPATIGQGMTVWSATDNLTVEEREKIRIVLNSCGKSVSPCLSISVVT